MNNSFEKIGWRWQLDRLQQQLGEWLEVRLSSISSRPKFDPLPSWVSVFLVRLSWLLLAGLLLWFCYQVIYPYWQQWLAKNRRIKSEPNSSIVQSFTVTELLAKSQQFKQDCNYTQAARWLYLAMLQRLNDAKLIPHQLSLTDREYLRLLDAFPAIQSGNLLISTHEQIHFGDAIVTEADFDRCQQACREIMNYEL